MVCGTIKVLNRVELDQKKNATKARCLGLFAFKLHCVD